MIKSGDKIDTAVGDKRLLASAAKNIRALLAAAPSDLYSRVLAAIELSRIPPELHFFYIKETRGMDLVEAIRSRSNIKAA